MTYEEMKDSSWGNVRALLQEKTYITIQSATA